MAQVGAPARGIRRPRQDPSRVCRQVRAGPLGRMAGEASGPTMSSPLSPLGFRANQGLQWNPGKMLTSRCRKSPHLTVSHQDAPPSHLGCISKCSKTSLEERPLGLGVKGQARPQGGRKRRVRVQGRSSRGGAEGAGLLEEGGLDRASALLTGPAGSGQSGPWHQQEEGHLLGFCGDATQPKPAPSWGHSSCPEPPGLRPGGPWGRDTSLHSARCRSSSSVPVAFRWGGAAQLQHSGPQHLVGKGEGLSALQRQEGGEATGSVAVP